MAEREVAAQAAVDRFRDLLVVVEQPGAQMVEQLVGRAPRVGREQLGRPPEVLDVAVSQREVTHPDRALPEPRRGIEEEVVVGGGRVDGAPDGAAADDRQRLVRRGDRVVGDTREARAQRGVRRAGGLGLDRPDPAHGLGRGLSPDSVESGNCRARLRPRSSSQS